MDETAPTRADRYIRQQAFAPLPPGAQDRLAAARVTLVGVGGLGSWMATLMARAGLGALRIVDDDTVDWTNLHRQAMYTEADAAARTPKAFAAERALAGINRDTRVEAVRDRLTGANAADLLGRPDLLLDGTDNFPARFILNDYAFATGTPWVFAGVLGAEGQVMPILPPHRPCLRCLFAEPPDRSPTCAEAGVLGPAVALVASMAAMEAIKLLTGCPEASERRLVKLDLWRNTHRRLEVARFVGATDCPCCVGGRFDSLNGPAGAR